MSDLAQACQSVPFSNGTEGDAWMSKWCEFCALDHGMHHGGSNQPMCEIIGNAMLGGEHFVWPEAWLPEPDDGRFALPSRLICGAFTPCHEGGCSGDPGADARAERVAEVRAYWANTPAPPLSGEGFASEEGERG